MSKSHVEALYCSVIPQENARIFVDQMFSVFDKDDNGYLDFHVRHDIELTIRYFFPLHLDDTGVYEID